MAYEQNGQHEAAISELHLALSYAPDNAFALTSLGHVYAVSGNAEKACEVIERLNDQSTRRYVPSYGMAEVYAGLQDKDQALNQLEKAVAERSWWLVFAAVNPRFDRLRAEPRFQKVLRQMNL
jgi:tetratricopeptide (TPR) repeat protein